MKNLERKSCYRYLVINGITSYFNQVYVPLLESPRELTPAEIEAAGRAWYSLAAGEQ